MLNPSLSRFLLLFFLANCILSQNCISKTINKTNGNAENGKSIQIQVFGKIENIQKKPKNNNKRITNKINSTAPDTKIRFDKQIHDYLETVKQIIEKNKYYPKNVTAERLPVSVIITAVITNNGEVHDCMVSNADGSGEFGDAGVNIVKKSSPFPKFPKELNIEAFRMNITIIYK